MIEINGLRDTIIGLLLRNKWNAQFIESQTVFTYQKLLKHLNVL